MPRFSITGGRRVSRGVSGGPRLGAEVPPGTGVAGPVHNLNYRQREKHAEFTYHWNGAQVLTQINRATFRAFNRIAVLTEKTWVEVVHVITGHLRDSLHVILDVARNNKVALLITNTAEYADFEERGTIYREGHFPMRQTLDRVVPKVRGILREEYAREGFKV